MLLAIASAPLALIAVVLTVVVVLGGGGCGSSGDLSAAARSAIPADIAPIYVAMAARWDIDVAFLASIGAQESDHGRSPRTNLVNSSGCQGLMQVGVGGDCGDFWGRNQCDGDGDGVANITDPWDNICAAARGLRVEKGAPAAGGDVADYQRAACRYYGARSDICPYGLEVMARAAQYGFVGGRATDPQQLSTLVQTDSTSRCVAGAASVTGHALVIDPGANRAGAGLTPQFVALASRIAALLPQPLVLTTGTNHSRLTTTGAVSDHWSGNAGDFGSARNGFPATGGGYGDQIAAAALRVAGLSAQEAAQDATRGGAFTVATAQMRVQVIWKSLVGGNHYDHVHVGIEMSREPGAVGEPTPGQPSNG
jgi:hypothetical protein